jgi:inner membrane protein
LARRLRQELTPLQLLGCAAVLLLADAAYQRAGDSFFPGGPLDETAHFLTALLLLQLLPTAWRAAIAIPALVGSVAIDLDHVPQYLGDRFLTVGTPRPYTHSLLTPLVLLALALVMRRHRVLFLGLALGVLLHFVRDLAEGNGSGVSLLWPLSDQAFSYPHATYLVLMAGVLAADLCLVAFRPRLQALAQ